MVQDLGAQINLSTNADKVAEIVVAALRRMETATKTTAAQAGSKQILADFKTDLAGAKISSQQIRLLFDELNRLQNIKGVPKDIFSGLIREVQDVIRLEPAYVAAIKAEADAGNQLARSLLHVAEAQEKVNQQTRINRVTNAVLPSVTSIPTVTPSAAPRTGAGGVPPGWSPPPWAPGSNAPWPGGVPPGWSPPPWAPGARTPWPGGVPPGWQPPPYWGGPGGGGRGVPPPPPPIVPPAGGGGGAGGGGWMGGRGTFTQQLANTARISLLYSGMYQALYGLEQFLSNAVQSFSEFQIALLELSESANVSVQEARTMAEAITDIGAAFGAAATDALRVAIQARGVSPEGGEQFVQQAVRTASQLALITGQSATEIGQSLNGLTVAFDTSQKVIGDASTYFNKKYGVLAPTLAGEARIAPLAAQAGLKPEELSAIFSALSARLAETPDALAASLTQVLSRPDLVDLTQFGATAGKSFADQVEEVGRKFDQMSRQTQNELIFQFGRGKSGQAALELFRQFPAIRQQVAAAGPQIAGKAEELAQARMRTFAGAMQHLQVQVANLANSIGQAGLLAPLGGVIFALTELVDLLNSLLGPLTRLPDEIKTIVALLIDLAIALRVAKAVAGAGGLQAGITSLAGRVAGGAAAGAGAGAGAAGLFASLRLGFSRFLTTFAKGFGPVGLGITGLLLGINAWQEANQAQNAAMDDFTTALGKSGSTAEDMADAAAASAEALENQSLITRAVTQGERERLRETEATLQAISELRPVASKETTEIATVLRETDVSTALAALEDMGVSGTEAFRRLAQAAAVNAPEGIPGAPGEGLVERQKAALAKIFGDALVTAGESLQPPKPKEPEPKGPPRGAGGPSIIPQVDPLSWFASIVPWGPDKAAEANKAIADAVEELMSQLAPGEVLTDSQLSVIANQVLKAIGVDPDDPDWAEKKENLIKKIMEALDAAGSSALLVNDAVAVVLNKWGPLIEAAKADTASKAALFKPAAMGPNLSFSPAEVRKSFEALGKMDLSVLQPGSLVAAQMGQIKDLESLIAKVRESGDFEQLQELYDTLNVKKRELADAIIGPAMATLTAAFGDLSAKDKSSAELKNMVSAIASLIPLVYKSGDAMAQLIGGMDSQVRALVRAKIAANKKIVDAAVKSATDVYLKTLGDLQKAEGVSTEGRWDPTDFAKNVGKALDTSGLEALQKTQKDLQAQLDAFDKAIAGMPSGPGTDAKAKAEKTKKDVAKKLDTAAQIAAAKALAEATRVADPVRIAAAQLQVAMADLDAIARDTENGGKNSVAYYNALAGVYKAQQELASTIVQASHQVRLLGIDLTDPVQQAQAEYQLALDNLNSLMSQGLSENALNPARVDVRQKEAAAQAAAFQQMFGDLQTNEQLKRISHQEFIRSVQAERDRLAAQRSLLSASSNMYRQITDQINQLDQALMAASESMNTMFNLGAIKIPTVYEVRRFMESAFEGLNFLAGGMQDQMRPGGGLVPVAPAAGAVDNRNVEININGGDLEAVQAVVMEAAGVGAEQQVVGARPHKF
jgi:hypothetical protein